MDARPDGATIIALSQARRRRRWLLKAAAFVLIASALVAVFVFRVGRTTQAVYRYLTTPATIGDLRQTVTATGTLKGLDTVDVGAQTSGRIVRVGADINDQVKTGQILAELDPVQMRSRVEQARAQVQAADAAVRLARATASQSKLQFDRIRDLNQKGLASNKDLESAQADAERSAANVASAQAQTTLSRASLKDAETSLSYTTVRSPIDGIVLARYVESGQTVVTTMQSQALFTLARDLTQLELRVDIDEADVGRVKKDQTASFTVDAWSNRRFSSRVISVYNLPTSSTSSSTGSSSTASASAQSVVTYKAVLSVDNKDLSLRPGMTATASIVTSERSQVLLVPNAAVRFTPPLSQSANRPPGLPLFSMRPPGPGPSGVATRPANPNQATVWTLGAAPGAEPQPIRIETAGTDGELTEVVPGPLKPGTPLIVDVEQEKQP